MAGFAAARRRSYRPAQRRSVALAAAVAAVVTFGAFVPGDAVSPHAAGGSDRPGDGAAVPLGGVQLRDDSRWLRTDADIPPQYRRLIVEAGTMCGAPQVTPALVAAVLKAESGFDATLSDPDKDEYGIARWTPRVLRYYLPPERQGAVPTPPFSPEDSIPAVGRMLCALAPELEGVPGDPALNLAAAYRTSTWKVRSQGPELQQIQPHLDQVREHMLRYRPPATPS
ncbi:hypothetical protein GPJ59_16135 [Streptomyces bambusae]|uniref:Lytic transglycosylase domain-containing protein n=1 Tax=Streptomyces bambusae TaxID=1550616 RepID=A0ABS6Z727_9ACTN|nr:hypothetical protein [Streptomyces bambusae]